MYAIFEDGGKQYKVQPGDAILVERRDLKEAQSEIVFDKILMLGEGEQARIGTPWVSGASVSGTLVQELKLPKVVGVKFRRRKGYMKKWGHRQQMLKVQINTINA